jgi:hypothetical protein
VDANGAFLVESFYTPGAAAIVAAAAPVASMLRLIGSIIGVLLDRCHARSVGPKAPKYCAHDRLFARSSAQSSYRGQSPTDTSTLATDTIDCVTTEGGIDAKPRSS